MGKGHKTQHGVSGLGQTLRAEIESEGQRQDSRTATVQGG